MLNYETFNAKMDHVRTLRAVVGDMMGRMDRTRNHEAWDTLARQLGAVIETMRIHEETLDIMEEMGNDYLTLRKEQGQ